LNHSTFEIKLLLSVVNALLFMFLAMMSILWLH